MLMRSNIVAAITAPMRSKNGTIVEDFSEKTAHSKDALTAFLTNMTPMRNLSKAKTARDNSDRNAERSKNGASDKNNGFMRTLRVFIWQQLPGEALYWVRIERHEARLSDLQMLGDQI